MQHATCNIAIPLCLCGKHEKQLWLTSEKSAQKSVNGVEDYATYKHHISRTRHHLSPTYTLKVTFSPSASTPRCACQDFLLVPHPMTQACYVYDLDELSL